MIKFKDISVLIVEDEFIASEYLSQILFSFRIKNIFKATSAKEALDIVKNDFIDLAFMDINIKGSIDGIECANLLNKEYFLPIIFSTAYGDTNTINEAKDGNIFGYLVKPFQSNDVEAALHVAMSTISRIKEFSKIKNTPDMFSETINLGKDYKYNLATKTVTLSNIPINLTKKELELLNILCRNLNNNISYSYIKETIWSDKNISDSTVRDVISRLKKKLPKMNIENIANYGYVLKQI